MMRAFFAIKLNEEIKHQLYEASKQLREHLNLSVKWVKETQLHLTLRFLGNITPEDSQKIMKSLTFMEDIPSFSLKFQQLIAFPAQKPRIIGVGIDLSEDLTTLVDNLTIELKKIGFEPEDRSFMPHITLGRIAKPRRRGLTLDAIILPTSQCVSQITLFQSELSPEGSIYSILHEFPLRGVYADACN